MDIAPPDKSLAERKVIKADGTIESFSWQKLTRSLSESHVEPQMIEEIGHDLAIKDRDMDSTDDIRKNVAKFLRKKNPYAAARYNLRESLMKLGPTGFPFEKYISYLFAALGYQTKIDQIVQGLCVAHEVDVILKNENEHHMVECKFHNVFGVRTDVKVAMYVWARFMDIKDAWEKQHSENNHFHQGWLITNTKVTSDAQVFGECRGVKIISWGYPEGNNLRELIHRTNMYPITSLTSLSKGTMQALLDRDVVTCKMLSHVDPKLVADLPSNEIAISKHEAELICSA